MKENIVKNKSFEFALKIIELYRILQSEKEYVISKQLLNKPGIKANKKKVSVIPWSDDEIPDYNVIADKMDKVLEKLSD